MAVTGFAFEGHPKMVEWESRLVSIAAKQRELPIKDNKRVQKMMEEGLIMMAPL